LGSSGPGDAGGTGFVLEEVRRVDWVRLGILRRADWVRLGREEGEHWVRLGTFEEGQLGSSWKMRKGSIGSVLDNALICRKRLQDKCLGSINPPA
jgi:hypothetical protein